MSKQLSLLLVLLMPLAFLIYMLFVHEVNDPIKYIYTLTGGTAITLLYITTTLSMLKKAVNLIKYRRTVGLFSFFYAFLHMLNFLILDMELDLASAVKETLDKPFIYLGMSVFFILLFMAITSLRALFNDFYKYHKVIYIALLLVTIHFVMAQKALAIDQWFYLLIMIIIGAFKFLQRTKLLNI